MRVFALGLALLTASTVNGVNRCLDPDSPSYGCQLTNGFLDLNNCSIADGDVEDLASCFNNTGRGTIKALRLGSNDLTTLPAGLFDGLESLKWLELSSNNLTTLPARLFNDVEGLGALNLSSNHLTTLPAGLFDGLWLDALDLSGNANLQCLPAGSPSTLVSEYSMYDSPPFTILPGGFDGSRTCGCPEEACEGCESGKYGYTCPGINRINWRLDPDRESYRCQPGYWLIDLQNSGITDDDMEDLASCFDNAGRATIRSVYLSSYRLTTLPEGIFDGLGALTDLFLGSSFLSALPAGLFDGLEALDTLILASDRLTTLPAGSFDGLGALETLDLSRSANLQCLPGGAPEYTTLPDDFGGSGICGCPDEACDNCQPGKFGYTCDGITRTNPCLDSDSPDYRCQSGNEDVDLKKCRLVDGDVEYLASCFDNSGRGTLRKVNLQHNGLTTLPTGLFDGLEALTELNLEHNGVTTLPAGLFDGLEALTNLQLGYNGLTTLPPGLFNGLRALRSLNINKNGLTTLPAGALDDLGALGYLDISQNSLTTLPAGLFDGLGALKRLSAGNNQLTTLPPKGFEHLGALTELHLNDNNLTSVPPGYFDGLGALNRLFLSRNNLTTLPAKIFDGVGNLKDLRLGENNLTTLRAGIFDGVGKLSYLDLGATNLTNLPVGVFDGLEALGTLDLGRNNLTTLPARMFDHLGRLKQLILSENVNLQCLPSGSPSRTSLPKNFAGNGTCECPHEACEDCQPGKFGYACPGTNHINPCFAPDDAKYLCQSGNEKM